MHRTFEIALSEEGTNRVLSVLEESEHVLSLSVHRGASVKPPGDVIVAHVLNRGANHILGRIGEKAGGSLAIAISEVGALVDREHEDIVGKDVDEAIWEEAESEVRHQGQLTQNFLLLMALGGAVGAMGFVMESTAQTIALVAASIIAPGFEVVARVPLGLVLRRRKLVVGGLRALLAGYSALVAGGALAFLLLLAVGRVDERTFADNSKVDQLVDPTSFDILLSSCGAIAGVTMILAYRRAQLAGPLVALALIPAGSMVGVALVTARFDLMLEGLERLGLDMLLVLGWGLVVFLVKQGLVHRREPLA